MNRRPSFCKDGEDGLVEHMHEGDVGGTSMVFGGISSKCFREDCEEVALVGVNSGKIISSLLR